MLWCNDVVKLLYCKRNKTWSVSLLTEHNDEMLMLIPPTELDWQMTLLFNKSLIGNQKSKEIKQNIIKSDLRSASPLYITPQLLLCILKSWGHIWTSCFLSIFQSRSWCLWRPRLALAAWVFYIDRRQLKTSLECKTRTRCVWQSGSLARSQHAICNTNNSSYISRNIPPVFVAWILNHHCPVD